MSFQKDHVLKAWLLSPIAAERWLYHEIGDSIKGLTDWWIHSSQLEELSIMDMTLKGISRPPCLYLCFPLLFLPLFLLLYLFQTLLPIIICSFLTCVFHHDGCFFSLSHKNELKVWVNIHHIKVFQYFVIAIEIDEYSDQCCFFNLVGVSNTINYTKMSLSSNFHDLIVVLLWQRVDSIATT